MDSLQTVLAVLVLSSPMVAAAAIAACGLTANRRAGSRLAMLGAAVSFCAAAAALVRLNTGQLDPTGSLSLGTWLSAGPHDPLPIAFGMRLDFPAAVLSAVMSLSTLCAFAWNGPRLFGSPSERLVSISALFLLSSSLGFVMSTNVGELFVFWQVSAVSAYLMSSAVADTLPRAGAAKTLILTQRLTDFCLLCAVFAIAIGYQTLDIDELQNHLLARGGVHRFALVHFIGLCLLGACAGRCALIPFLGWTEGLTAGPALVAVLIEGICLMPAGVVLLIRFQPVMHAATAASDLGIFLGGTSAFCAAICAWSETNARRQAGFACASVFGVAVLGLCLSVGSTVTTSAAVWALILTATLLPTSAAVLGWFATEPPSANDSHIAFASKIPLWLSPEIARGAVAVSIALLFSGICGQGGILAAGLRTVVGSGRQASLTLALAYVLALCAQYFTAIAMTRALLGTSSQDAGGTTRSQSVPASIWPMLVLAGCGITIGLIAGPLLLVPLPAGGAGAKPFAAGSMRLAGSLVGCLPALAGFVVGWRQARRDPANQTAGQQRGLLARLGRSRFYCDALLFLFVVVWIRGFAQFARLIDWVFIDGFVSVVPASVVDSAAALLEPIQRRNVSFYLASAAVGTGLLSVVIVWLRN